jgi:sec-independent protein translocase protein TatC
MLWTMTAFGLMFQTPLIVFFLIKSGVTTPEVLTGYRRHVIVGLAAAAALLTPGPDIVSQIALLLPTYILFEAAVLLARWTENRPFRC